MLMVVDSRAFLKFICFDESDVFYSTHRNVGVSIDVINGVQLKWSDGNYEFIFMLRKNDRKKQDWNPEEYYSVIFSIDIEKTLYSFDWYIQELHFAFTPYDVRMDIL